MPKTKDPARFIILVEVLERELPAQVLLGLELVTRGHHVWLVDKATFHQNPALFPSSVILAKSLSKSCFEVFRQFRLAGHKIAVLGQEAILDGDPENFLSRRVFDQTLQQVDLICFWGESHRRIFFPRLKSGQNYAITGNPRFDLLHPRFRLLWSEPIGDIRREYGNRVLITTRFSLVNHFKRSVEHNIARKEQKSVGKAARSYARWLLGLEAVFKKYSQDLVRLTAELQDIQFVIRPKPRENVEYWRLLFKGNHNVKVVLDGSAIPWLAAAKCVVHNACTTGIEAFMLGRPVIEYHPAKLAVSELDPTLPGRVTGTVDSIEQLADWLNVHWSGSFEPEIDATVRKIIGEHFHGFTDGDAHLRLADALEGLSATIETSADTPRQRPLSRIASKQRIPLTEVDALLSSLMRVTGHERRITTAYDALSAVRLKLAEMEPAHL
jgi:surface carbohydrate biosynthesis protein